MTEAYFEGKIAVPWLKEQGAVVIKNKAGPGVPTGFPDRTILYKAKYCLIEFKKSEDAPYRVGQKATLKFFRGWGVHALTAYPENWEEVKAYLLRFFF